MADLSVDVAWTRTSPSLTTGQYNTGHTIIYSADHALPGDAAPDWGGDPAATNPEQALAASLSSCHMMTFLALAAKAGWPVASYADCARAYLGKNAAGKMAVTELKLAPRVSFDVGFAVQAEDLLQMHERAHRYCFVANAISAKMTLRPKI